MEIINISQLDIVFGKKTKEALNMLDNGFNREEIKHKIDCVVGVNNISLTINQGEIFVLMGLSGSGKSTLLRAINGLNKITRGSLQVFSYALENCNDKTLREIRKKYISMVFQNFALLPWRTVLDNVAFGLEIAQTPKKKRIDLALEAIELVGLSSWTKQYPKELSGGMQQRVGLARALATKSDILLMDEPFSALDPLTRSHLQDELLKLQAHFKKTIIFVTHDFEEALKLGSRIAILKDGHLIQIGHPKDILLKDKSNEFILSKPN